MKGPEVPSLYERDERVPRVRITDYQRTRRDLPLPLGTWVRVPLEVAVNDTLSSSGRDDRDLSYQELITKFAVTVSNLPHAPAAVEIDGVAS